MSTSIILCGVGGQGTVLASKLLSDAAMAAGLPVKTAETIGMAQRGGSVTSHVRLGEGCASPLIGHGRADVLIGFEPAEAVRQLGYLRPGGTAIVANRPVVPASAFAGGPAYELKEITDYLLAQVPGLVVVDVEAAARVLGSFKCLNVVLLGAAAACGALAFSEEELRDAISRRIPDRLLELNLQALELGASFAA